MSEIADRVATMMTAHRGVLASLEESGMLEALMARQPDMNELVDECRKAGLSEGQVGAFIVNRFMEGLAPPSSPEEANMRSLALAVAVHFLNERSRTPR